MSKMGQLMMDIEDEILQDEMSIVAIAQRNKVSVEFVAHVMELMYNRGHGFEQGDFDESL